MVDKVLKVSENLVVIFFTNKPHITIATDDGTAMKLAMGILVDSARRSFTDAA